jgi:predicted transcriptional regulator of viral defense system
MKNTILSEKDIKSIEKAILKYGRILTVDDLMSVFKENYSAASAHNRISLIAKAGWFRRIKRGLYLIIDSLMARSQMDVSLLSIANAIVRDSYVSLSHALNYYQLFDQYSATVVSIACTANKKYIFDDYVFRYSKVKKDMYFGFTEKTVNGKKIRLAEAEKALIDYLYLDKSFETASLVFEKLKEHHHELDIKKLQEFATRCGFTIARKIGFMLDRLQLDSNFLHSFINKNRGISRFTADSKIFNAKWRLYYDDRIIG